VRASRTTLLASSTSRTVFEDVVIDGLKTRGLEFIYSTVFKRVVLKGKIGRFVLRNEQGDDGAWMAEEYKGVDWALDLRELVAQELDINNVPPELILRDSATQAIIRLENVKQSDWQKGQLGVVGVWIEGMLAKDLPACIVVAPKGNKKLFAKMMAEIREARERGIADPD
jgi:hypothetical protein